MSNRVFLLVCGLSLAACAHQSYAQTLDRFSIRGGPAYAAFDASAHVSVSGAPVAGGDASVHSNTGAEFELGYRFRPEWQASFAVGVPPKARIFGSGTLSAAGKLGEATYGPTVLSVLYAPVFGNLRPYLGPGVNYTFIFGQHDGSVRQLQVKNAWGAALQFGAEYQIGPHLGWFVDVKKIWLSTTASGFIDGPAGPLPARARVTLDPVIVNTGLSFHF